jgi:VanZ family protein
VPERFSLRLWLPPILWTAAILMSSTASFSSSNTGDWLAKLINAIVGHPLAPESFLGFHFLLRKAAHLTGYGIEGALLYRAIRAERAERPPRLRWAIAAVAITAVVATIDEWHQLYIPSRTGSPLDVLIDTLGATLAQVLFFKR